MRSRRVVDPNPSPLFENEIPKRIRDEIETVVDQTEKDGKEKSLTFCVVGDRIHTSNYAKGQRGSTEVKPCNEKKYGKSEKIGDMHTHPVEAPGTGIMTSEADFTLNLIESKQLGKKQISCITNHESKYVSCFYPKDIPDSKKIRKYENALDNTSTDNDVDPYFRKNIQEDFNHAYYNRKTWKRVTPDARNIVSDALGRSTERLRDRDIHDIEKGTYCDLVAGYQIGSENKQLSDQVETECKRVLKKRKFTSYSLENILFGKTK